MSEETVESMRRSIELWNRDDFDGWMALTEEVADSSVEFHPAIAQRVEGEERVYRGIDGMRRFWEDSHAVFEARFGEIEIRDLGDTLLVLGHASFTGRGSGVSLETPIAFVVSYDGDRMTRTRQYLSHAEALQAVGLEE